MTTVAVGSPAPPARIAVVPEAAPLSIARPIISMTGALVCAQLFPAAAALRGVPSVPIP